MQDPFFHLTPEQPIDLNTLFTPGEPTGGSSRVDSEGNNVSLEETTPEESEQQKVDEIIEKYKEEEVPQTTLEERIKQIEKQYNETPIPIYGEVQKRLVTLARKLTKKHLYQQAKSVCKIIDGE